MTGATCADVIHVTFNPQPIGFDSPLQRIVDVRQRDGWALLRVVAHHQYESVAVFVRVAADASTEAPQ